MEGACGEGGDGSVPVVEVGPEGVVRAGEQTGQATVIVTVTESYGVTQSLSVLVEVKWAGQKEQGCILLPCLFTRGLFAALPFHFMYV